VEALVGQSRQGELVWFGGDERGALLFREADAHRRLVRRDRDVHDLADPELDVIVDQVLGSPGQRQRHRAHLGGRDQRASLSWASSAPLPS